MKGFVPRNDWERLLKPILTCLDCHGLGERWHAQWPHLAPPKPVSLAVLFDASVEKRWGVCETCAGDGRLRVPAQM